MMDPWLWGKGESPPMSKIIDLLTISFRDLLALAEACLQQAKETGELEKEMQRLVRSTAAALLDLADKYD